MPMKLFFISQSHNRDYDSYDADTYDAAIVAAETAKKAVEIHPDGQGKPPSEWDEEWTTPDNVKVRYIGKAAHGTKPGVILASFNAG